MTRVWGGRVFQCREAKASGRLGSSQLSRAYSGPSHPTDPEPASGRGRRILTSGQASPLPRMLGLGDLVATGNPPTPVAEDTKGSSRVAAGTDHWRGRASPTFRSGCVAPMLGRGPWIPEKLCTMILNLRIRVAMYGRLVALGPEKGSLGQISCGRPGRSSRGFYGPWGWEQATFPRWDQGSCLPSKCPRSG
jgi:hypothetical protein